MGGGVIWLGGFGGWGSNGGSGYGKGLEEGVRA